MIKYSLPFLLLIVYTLNVNGQLRSLEKTKVDEIFKELNGKSTPGLALGIIKDGSLIYTKGYGMADLEHDIAITDSTIFYIGSVSKQFVTMCLLILEEQGKLNLDDRIQKYFPDFPEYNAPLTIRHFIHHTSGVRDNLTLWELAGNDYLDHIDKEEMYQLIRKQKELNFTPGEKYLYSNSCYFILGMIIEKVSGESLKAFAQNNIFGPLGMRNTFFGDDNTRIIKNRAFSYLLENGTYKNQILRYDLVGSGGVYSNIKDLYFWDQNFYHNKLGKGSQGLIDKMHMDGKLNDGKGSGYAFAIQNGKYRGLTTVGHAGALAGYRSSILRFPIQKLSVLILGNVSSIPINKLPYRVADILLEEQLAPLTVAKATTSVEKKIKEEQKDFNIANADQYPGAFYSDELNVMYEITVKANQLYCSIKNKQPVGLHPQGQDLFTMGDGVKLKFERDDKRQIIGFSVDAGRVTNLKFKRK
ncbi:MAG: serine hydrolase domain-containing protein [Ferruginibacter sp.]